MFYYLYQWIQSLRVLLFDHTISSKTTEEVLKEDSIDSSFIEPSA